MTIDEMRERKRELGYTSEKLAELSGVPVSTVRKIMSGATRSPRQETIEALADVLRKKQGEYGLSDFDRIPDGYRVELIGGKFYGLGGSGPLAQEVVDSMLFKESPPAYYGTGASVSGTSALKGGSKTIEDFEAMPEGWRGELINGELYALASPTTAHQRIVLEIAFQFKSYSLQSDHACEVFTSPVDVQLRRDIKEVFEPDVVVLCDPSKDNGKRIIGPPDLLVEVISPSDRARDMVLKLGRYMETGVREYWVVDGDKRQVLVYDFDNGLFAECCSFDEKIPVGISGGELKIDLSRL
ncbi:MAG: Uma2 family endonuclease [Firmicutes bacterium]|nr:Uma2 family endonuclease [Bacillota bacterium]